MERKWIYLIIYDSIMIGFVLIFTVDTEERTVSPVHFSHHDDAYGR
jgi:hypothetical protein